MRHVAGALSHVIFAYPRLIIRTTLEVLHLDHIGPLTKDAHGNEYILVIFDAFSRWVELFFYQVDDRSGDCFSHP